MNNFNVMIVLQGSSIEVLQDYYKICTKINNIEAKSTRKYNNELFIALHLRFALKKTLIQSTS